MKLTQNEMEERRQIVNQARAITKAADVIDIMTDSYINELTEKYIVGEITSKEKKQLILESYKCNRG